MESFVLAASLVSSLGIAYFTANGVLTLILRLMTPTDPTAPLPQLDGNTTGGS